MTPRAPNAPVLISLPDGLSVSGVTLWAVRLAGVLAARGHPVTLMAHNEPAGQARLDVPVPAGVRVEHLDGLPPLRAAAGDLSPFIPAYRDEARRLARRTVAPVVCLPTTLGDSFAIAAALAQVDPELIRVVGFQHADTAYDARILAHYEPVLASLVGVSARVVQTLAAALPHRLADIAHLPNAVPADDAPPERTPLTGRPLRLVYTGRIEHKQKRVAALIEMSDELARRAIDHRLSLVGDGPALPEIRDHAAGAARISLPGAVSPHTVRSLLRDSDCFVLASRYEGLSVAMLEAMASGCVPIVTGVASGADEVVVNGLSGILVRIDTGAGDRAAGLAMADAVARFVAQPANVQARFAIESWRRVKSSFSLESYAPRAGAIINAAASSPQRPWPASRPVAFTSAAAAIGASGTVPADAASRLAALLESLADRRIILHGAGRHTIELAGVLAHSPARIVGVADDDPGRWGQPLLGWMIIPPARAGDTGATDAIISSWIHADEVYARRDVYERQGLRLHHLYRDAGTSQPGPYNAAACSS